MIQTKKKIKKNYTAITETNLTQGKVVDSENGWILKSLQIDEVENFAISSLKEYFNLELSKKEMKIQINNPSEKSAKQIWRRIYKNRNCYRKRSTICYE